MIMKRIKKNVDKANGVSVISSKHSMVHQWSSNGQPMVGQL